MNDIINKKQAVILGMLLLVIGLTLLNYQFFVILDFDERISGFLGFMFASIIMIIIAIYKATTPEKTKIIKGFFAILEGAIGGILFWFLALDQGTRYKEAFADRSAVIWFIYVSIVLYYFYQTIHQVFNPETVHPKSTQNPPKAIETIDFDEL